GWVGQDAEVPPPGAALEAAAREELAGAMAGVAGPSGPEWIAHAQRMLDAGAAHRGDVAGAERELDLAVSDGVAREEEAGAPVESLRPAEDELLTEQLVEMAREELAVSEDRLDTLRAEGATRSGDRLVAEIDRLEREVAEAEAEGRDASTAERRLAEASDELARRGEEAERAGQAATAREARSAHLEEDGESLVADVVTRQGAEAVMAAGARLDEGDGAARRVDRGVGDAGRSAGSAPGDGSGGGGEGTDGNRWPLADPSGRSLAERPDYAWEAEFLDLVGGWRDPLAHRPERGWQRGWVDLGGNRWDWERYDEWRARQEAERGSGRREEEPEPWQWTYRGPRPHWMGKDTTREEQEAASPLGPTGWGYTDVPVNLGRLGPVWTQGGYYEPRLSPEQQAELRETFDKYHDWDRWDLAFHDDGFERLRTSWDADVEWRDPDGRMQTLPMRVGEMEAWYRREQEINLEASERLWDALRQQYRERYWVTPVEGEPRAIVDAARPDAEVDRAMAAWREAHGWVEPRLARPPTEDELHARAEAEERALFAALREMHVGDPWTEALVDAVQARCDMTTSRIDARGARPGETVDEWLARTSPERAVERGPSGRVEPPEEDVDAFLRDPDAWDGWPDPGRVQVMTEAIEALVAADRPALPTGDAQPSAGAAERRGEGVRWAESLPGAGEGEGPEEAVRSHAAEGASATLEDHPPALELEDDDMRGVGLVGGVPPQGVSEQGAADLEAAMDAVVAGEATGAPVADGDDHDVARASAGDSLTAEDDLLDVGVPPDHRLEADDAALRSDEERAEADRTLAMSADEDERGDRAEAEELAADEDGRAEMLSHTDEQALTSPGPEEAEPEDERAADADPATDALEPLDDTALPLELADEIALPSEEAMAAQDGAEWEASTSAEMAAEEEDEMEPSGGMEEDDDWD
ncbi:MAG: hypothetical protein QOG45_425, partial [Chloroflexota bacterium]|nr:hypothetical protein [Chloroflexota bacterium]